MKSARVSDFHAILISYLTQYDQKESAREMNRRGHSNIYRLGHLFGAAEKVEKKAKSAGIWARDDLEALSQYETFLTQHFSCTRGRHELAPLRQLEKKINAWVDHGKFPLYGKLRANPHWTGVFK